MPVVKTTLSLTDQDRKFMDGVIASGEFVSNSEYVRNLIRKDKERRIEPRPEIEHIRTKLIASEKSVEKQGWVDKTPAEMLQGFKEKARLDRKL